MSAPWDAQSVKMTFKEVIERFNAGIKEAENLLVPARSSKLQVEQCFKLDILLFNATRLKHEAIRWEQENHANIFLGYECAIGAVRSELMMWILLKRDRPNEAWSQLVAAQMACLDAVRAD